MTYNTHPWLSKWWDVKHYCAEHTAVLWAAFSVLSTVMPTTCGLCLSKAFQLYFSTEGKGSSILVTTWNCEKYLCLTRRVLKKPRELNADGPVLNPTGSDTCQGTCTNMDAACLNQNRMCNRHHKWLAAYCTCLVLESFVRKWFNRCLAHRHLPIWAELLKVSYSALHSFCSATCHSIMVKNILL